MIGNRLSILIVAVIFGLGVALLMVLTKGTGFGNFLQKNISIIMIVFAVIAVAASEIGKKK